MKFTKEQSNLLADYLSDLSKVLFASVVVGFFIPTTVGSVSGGIFIAGTLTAAFALFGAVQLAR